MYCIKCGKKLLEGAEFCYYCGNRTLKETSIITSEGSSTRENIKSNIAEDIRPNNTEDEIITSVKNGTGSFEEEAQDTVVDDNEINTSVSKESIDLNTAGEPSNTRSEGDPPIWYYRSILNERKGPFSEREIEELANNGEITSKTKVHRQDWEEGPDGWIDIGNSALRDCVKELRDLSKLPPKWKRVSSILSWTRIAVALLTLLISRIAPPKYRIPICIILLIIYTVLFFGQYFYLKHNGEDADSSMWRGIIRLPLVIGLTIISFASDYNSAISLTSQNSKEIVVDKKNNTITLCGITYQLPSTENLEKSKELDRYTYKEGLETIIFSNRKDSTDIDYSVDTLEEVYVDIYDVFEVTSTEKYEISNAIQCRKDIARVELENEVCNMILYGYADKDNGALVIYLFYDNDDRTSIESCNKIIRDSGLDATLTYDDGYNSKSEGKIEEIKTEEDSGIEGLDKFQNIERTDIIQEAESGLPSDVYEAIKGTYYSASNFLAYKVMSPNELLRDNGTDVDAIKIEKYEYINGELIMYVDGGSIVQASKDEKGNYTLSLMEGGGWDYEKTHCYALLEKVSDQTTITFDELMEKFQANDQASGDFDSTEIYRDDDQYITQGCRLVKQGDYYYLFPTYVGEDLMRKNTYESKDFSMGKGLKIALDATVGIATDVESTETEWGTEELNFEYRFDKFYNVVDELLSSKHWQTMDIGNGPDTFAFEVDGGVVMNLLLLTFNDDGEIIQLMDYYAP